VGRIWTIVLAWGGIVLGLGLLLLGAVLEERQPEAAYLMPLGVVLFFGSAIVWDTLPRIVSAAYITEDDIWLKGIHPDDLARFPEFPGVKDGENGGGRSFVRDETAGRDQLRSNGVWKKMHTTPGAWNLFHA
jgi:hypothetical protein